MALDRIVLEEKINFMANKNQFNEVFQAYLLDYYRIRPLAFSEDKSTNPNYGMNYKMDTLVFAKVLKEVIMKYDSRHSEEASFIKYFNVIYKKRVKEPEDGDAKARRIRKKVLELKRYMGNIGLELNSLNEAQKEVLCRNFNINVKQFSALVDFEKKDNPLSIIIKDEAGEEYIQIASKAGEVDEQIKVKELLIAFFSYLEKTTKRQKLECYKMILVNILFASDIEISEFREIVHADYLKYIYENNIVKPKDIDVANFLQTSKANISKNYIKPFNELALEFKENYYDPDNI